MAKHRLTILPEGLELEAEHNASVLGLSRAHGLDIGSLCGGKGKCGKCRVRIQGDSGPVTALDRLLLSGEELASGWRLGCQALVGSDMVMHVPTKPLKLLDPEVYVPLIGADDPPVVAEALIAPPRTRNSEHAYREATREALRLQEINVTSETMTALRKLGANPDRQKEQLRCLVFDGELVDVRRAEEATYAIAFDIGTTTISTALLDLQSRSVIAIHTRRNPQGLYGADVISRIAYAEESPQHHAELVARIIDGLNETIDELTGAEKVDPQAICLVTVVGNPIMHHFFFGLDVSGMGALPFSPVVVDSLVTTAQSVGLRLNPETPVVGLPLICGYVGADTVGVILALNLLGRKETVMAIDVGTNGEMVLVHRERLYTCSAPAGPAWEGAQIECGMRAQAGAITSFRIRDHHEDVEVGTVHKAKPQGIAGTGLVDIAAELLRVGVVDPTGRFRKVEEWPPFLRERSIRVGGVQGFLISQGDGAEPVYLLQSDVRQLQMAKGAIASGISILLKEVGLAPEELEQVYIAGAFGSYLRPESVLRIGLVPPMPKEKIQSVGNAALAGAILAALSRRQLEKCAELRSRVTHIELSMSPLFQEEFVAGMLFPGPAGEVRFAAAMRAHEAATPRFKVPALQKGALRVGSTFINPPLMYLDGGKPAGFEHDLGEALAQRLGLRLEVVNVQRQIRTLALDRKEFDVILFCFVPDPGADDRFLFSQPYFTLHQAVIARKGSGFRSEADLEGKVVGVLRDSPGERRARQLRGAGGVVVYEWNDMLYRDSAADLAAGEIDALYYGLPVACHLARGHPELEVAFTLENGDQCVMVFRRGDEGLRDAVDRALADLRADGTYQRIYDRWFGPKAD